MQRKHGELGPIGEVVSGLDDVLVPTIRRRLAPGAPPLHPSRSGEPVGDGPRSGPLRCFMARMMALCSLPRSNPGNRIRYVRRNRAVHALHDGGRRL